MHAAWMKAFAKYINVKCLYLDHNERSSWLFVSYALCHPNLRKNLQHLSQKTKQINHQDTQ